MRKSGQHSNHFSHGHTCGGKRSPTYISWNAMKLRCLNKRDPSYADYGERGITVCARWRKFANFLADMGERPAGKTLDRYPNQTGNYEPGNCRWATPKEQVANSRRPDHSHSRTRLIGKTFGRLTVVSFANVGRNSQFKWNCLCACGTTKVMYMSGRQRSCGCERTKKIIAFNKRRFAMNFDDKGAA